MNNHVNFIFSGSLPFSDKVMQLGKLNIEYQESGEFLPFELLDCFDQSIRQSGQALIRTKNTLQLLQKNGATLTQRCSKRVGFIADLANGPVKEALAFISPLRRILIAGKGQLSCHSLVLLDSDHKTQARAFSQTYLSDGVAKPLNYATIQALRGYDKAFELLLQEVNQLKDNDNQDIASLYTRLIPHYQPYNPKPEIPIVQDELAFQAANDIITNYINVARLNEPGVIADYDSEFLHDYRVSLRKIRSVISLFKGVYSDEQTLYFKQAFSAQMEPTGALRDFDVYLLEREHYFELLPSSLHDGLTIMFQLFEKERNEQHKALKARFLSKAYNKSITDLASAFTSHEQLTKGINANHSVYGYACELIWKRYSKVCKIARAIEDKTQDERVHELRIHCKKLRYLMEFFAPMLPAQSIWQLIKSLKRLQDNLGLFNDYSVQQASLQLFLETHSSKNRKKDLTVAKSVGALIAVLYQRQLGERAKVVCSFAKFDSEKTQNKFRKLFQHKGE